MTDSLEDLIIWPDATHCTREELNQMTHMSDDYEVVRVGTGVYQLLTELLI